MTKQTMAWMLAVSVALDLFLAGFVVARELRVGQGRRGARLFNLGQVVDVAQSPALRDRLHEEMKRARPQRRALREARQEVRDALRLEPFDAKRLELALEKTRAQATETQRQLHQALVSIAEQLTPEQRQRLSETGWRPHRGPARPRLGPR